MGATNLAAFLFDETAGWSPAYIQPMSSRHVKFLTSLAILLGATSVACSAGTGTTAGDGDEPGGINVGDGDSGSGGGDSGSGDGDGDIGAGLGDGPSSNPGAPPAVIEETLPVGFTASVRAPMDAWDFGVSAPAAGGYRLVGSVADFSEEAENTCANVLRGIVRDFDAHPDFGGAKSENAPGLVAEALGADSKPVPTGIDTYTASALGDWYTNGGGGNTPYVVDFWLEPQADGSFVFDSSRFFPVEGVGSTSGADNDGVQRNFGFTTEIHTAFEYKGGEIFNFRGDDDVFVFINKTRVVDLGGVHGAQSASVNVDTIAATTGMVIGDVYELDLFHAERNPTGSNFRIETTLDFKECSILQQDLVVR